MPLLILQAKAPLEPRDDRTLVAIQQIKNLRYFQGRASEGTSTKSGQSVVQICLPNGNQSSFKSSCAT